MVTVVPATLVRGSTDSFPTALLVLAALGGIATVVGHLAARATPVIGAVMDTPVDAVPPLSRPVR
jgi:hypothetical protein